MHEQKKIKNVDSYQSARGDILEKIKRSPTRVLDVGCNVGSLGKAIKDKFPRAKVVGWDYNPDAIEKAKVVIDKAIVTNLDELQSIHEWLAGETFDLVVFGDVLEHLKEPWKVVQSIGGSLEPAGAMVISLPNFGHWETVGCCLRRRLPRNSRGIYDDTHLRDFMLNNLREFESDSLKIESVSRNLRLTDAGGFRGSGVLLRLIQYLPWVRDLFTFQYLMVLRKVF